MENPQFITFQKFNLKEDAVELATFLRESQIEYRIEDTSSGLDGNFGNSELAKDYLIKLKKEDFEKADILLLQISSNLVETIDRDHYLHEFTDEELKEIIVKKDEWSHLDFLLAQKILKERGQEIIPEEIEKHRKQRLEDLSKPEEHQGGWIIAGYLFAFLGGFLGFFIGWFLKTHKKTLPNGDRVYNYTESDRKQGNRILIVSLFFFLFWIGVRIFFSE
ncbi:hypothetical protein CLV94_0298 [Flavobacterium endophyticum]|uniref:DUF2007 domain-containing protein n=1 Tax=Flavobacterium endophyticum TaxID=1540163 RepID=A0A495MIL2_9FLAO|nr:hypothetical protein [Flavobacterium endophyticum]RKS25268.1 hypothetical protein CLV94_0298 [Flavobacterium endophyticum]